LRRKLGVDRRGPQTSVSRGECPGRRWNPSTTCMWPYDIWVKMLFNFKYSSTWILGAINVQKESEDRWKLCNKCFAVCCAV
jgi:hypothetical protein